MKKLSLILMTIAMLVACSSPKYAYYFDHYPTKSITPQTKPNMSKLTLEETFVASTSNYLFAQSNKEISLPKKDSKPYFLKTEANNIAIDTSFLPIDKDQVRIIKKDGSVIETKIMGRTANVLFIEGGQIDLSEIYRVVLPIGGYNPELIKELEKKSIVEYREVDPEMSIKETSYEPIKVGDKSKNKFAFAGWIIFPLSIMFLYLAYAGLALFLFLLSISFLLVGIKSQHRKLAIAGLLTMLVLFFLIIKIATGGMA